MTEPKGVKALFLSEGVELPRVIRTRSVPVKNPRLARQILEHADRGAFAATDMLGEHRLAVYNADGSRAVASFSMKDAEKPKQDEATDTGTAGKDPNGQPKDEQIAADAEKAEPNTGDASATSGASLPTTGDPSPIAPMSVAAAASIAGFVIAARKLTQARDR